MSFSETAGAAAFFATRERLHALQSRGDRTVPATRQLRQEMESDSKYTFDRLLWFFAAVVLFYYTDFLATVLYDERVNRPMLNYGVLFIGANFLIGLGMYIYVTFFVNVPGVDFTEYYPPSKFIATACMLVGVICTTIGLWPLWHIFTLPILFTMTMGILMSLSVIN